MHLITDQPHIFGTMKRLPNFPIAVQSSISSFFIKRNIQDFFSAIHYVRSLPSTMENSPHELLRIAKEGGTTNAKNALLATLAGENHQSAIKLSLCTYTVDYTSHSLLKCILEKYGLPAIPEVSCYLKHQGAFYTVAKESLQVTQAIISEIEIAPQQIGNFTQRYYHHFIEHWLQLEKLHHTWTVDKIKMVKQECLQLIKKQPWQLIHPPIEA